MGSRVMAAALLSLAGVDLGADADRARAERATERDLRALCNARCVEATGETLDERALRLAAEKRARKAAKRRRQREAEHD